MRLEQLEYLVEIAKNHSMSVAAQNLHIAQPSLSLAIKQLEQELNVVIFTRSRKGTFLTDKGEAIYLKACKILEDIQSLYANASATQTIKGELNILTAASFSTLIETLVPKLLQKYPLIKQSFNIVDAQEINRSLSHQDNYHIILTSLKTDDLIASPEIFERYHIYLIAEAYIQLLASKNSPYAKQKSISFSTLQKLPLIYYASEGNTNYLFSVLETYHLKLKRAVVTNDANSIIKHIQTGLVYGLVTSFQTDKTLSEECCTIPLKEKIAISFIMLVDKSLGNPPVYSAFFDILSDYYPQMHLYS